MREDSQRTREREVRRSRQDEEELQILRERCERLEEERTSAVCSVNSPISIAPYSSTGGLRSC